MKAKKVQVAVHRHDLSEPDDEHECSATLPVESMAIHPK